MDPGTHGGNVCALHRGEKASPGEVRSDNFPSVIILYRGRKASVRQGELRQGFSSCTLCVFSLSVVCMY